MKIAFVSGNRETLPDAVVPLGILYVMASTPAHHATELWDLCFDAAPLDALARRLREFRPDVVAVGMRNIQNSDYTGYRDTLGYYREVLHTIRRISTAPVVLGGGGFSVMPQGLMQLLRPDFGISGEGERAFAQLIGELDAGTRAFGTIPNLHYYVDGALVSTPPSGGFQVLDALPVPQRQLVDERYYTGYGIDSVQTKRGCPLRCDYCTYPIIEGRSIRERDPVRVVDEMVAAREMYPDIEHFFIVDSVFNLPPRHAKAMCRAMIDRKLDTPWTCYANPLGFDRELAELMKAASCAGIEIGSDSGCDEILDRLKKGFHTDKISMLHELCAEVGLPDCHTFILGTTGETLEQVNRTLDFCRDLDPFAAIMMIWTDDHEALDPELAAGRRAFREEIHDLLRRKEPEFPRWIVPPLGINFDTRMFELLRHRGFSGPLWQHIRHAGSAEQNRRLKRIAQALPEKYFSGSRLPPRRDRSRSG
jgi:radical SAM superfamily enzyme YgiQ (UPF0313 family)